MRMTWQTIKSVITNPCTKITIKGMFVNNIEYTDDNPIVEAFCNYFSEVAGILEAEIPQTSFDLLSLISTKSESVFFNPVSASDY